MRVTRCLTIFTEGDCRRGLGHVVRCQAYSHAWRAAGGIVNWVVDGDGAARSVLATETVRWGKWQTSPQPVSGDLALIDSYSAAPEVLDSIARSVPTVFIDDLFRVPYPKGLVVHSSPGPIDQLLGEATWLSGPRWHPLRPAFGAVSARAPTETVKRAAVFVGGVDHRRLSATLAQTIRRAVPGCKIDVVMGPGADPSIAIEGENLKVWRALSATEVCALMNAVDFAVSAAGQTLFELARCGCPTVMIGVADNQSAHMRHWPETGAGIAAAWWNDPALEDKVEFAIRSLDPPTREAMSRAGQATVDGLGVARWLEQVRNL